MKLNYNVVVLRLSSSSSPSSGKVGQFVVLLSINIFTVTVISRIVTYLFKYTEEKIFFYLLHLHKVQRYYYPLFSSYSLGGTTLIAELS